MENIKHTNYTAHYVLQPSIAKRDIILISAPRVFVLTTAIYTVYAVGGKDPSNDESDMTPMSHSDSSTVRKRAELDRLHHGKT